MLREPGTTKQAFIKLLRIAVFMVKKHWAHINNYEGSVRFIGNDLNEKVLGEYLSLSENHRNVIHPPIRFASFY